MLSLAAAVAEITAAAAVLVVFVLEPDYLLLPELTMRLP